MIETFKLPLQFDVDLLTRDLEKIDDSAWINHFNTGDYEGEWSALALRGPTNATHPIQSLLANPGITAWSDTEILYASSYFQRVLAQFKCPLLSVRLMRLMPQSRIKEHADVNLGLEYTEVRIHVPIQTSADVEFLVNQKPVYMRPGECWYFNANLKHAVQNKGHKARVHLVIDCSINTWLLSQFENLN